MDRQNWTRTVETSARRLLDILNDVLDLSKIEAGQMELRRQPCAPRQIVDEVIALFRPQAMAKNITLKGVISAELPGLIETDGPRVRQILINLVGNAIKFTAQGGVELVARVAHLADGERIYFDVSDTGPGISADQQARLFKPFAQGGNPGSRRQSGTGLGLAISSSLARMLGGDVTVLSEPGRGSTFTASIASCRVAAPIMDQSPAKLSFNSKLIGSVLIADDSGPIRRLLRNYLVGAGIGVMCARNGREAVEHVEYASAGGCPFDLVLMDLQMPEMDGFEAVRAMRDRGHAVPVIAITAAILQNSRSDCIAAGFDDLLNKPFDRERLLAVIGRYLGKQSDNATAEQPPACAA
jgi:CheY-like chemotaxis protein